MISSSSDSLPNFRILTKFQNSHQISSFSPSFRIFTKFQNCHHISSFWPIFRILTKFWNSDQILEFWQNSGISTKFWNFNQILVFRPNPSSPKISFRLRPWEIFLGLRKYLGHLGWISEYSEFWWSTYTFSTPPPQQIVNFCHNYDLLNCVQNFEIRSKSETLEIWSNFWNLVQIMKFGRNYEIWSKLWNLAEFWNFVEEV